VRVTILSRASDLARLQASLVGRALVNRFDDLEVAYATRTSQGDRDDSTPLAHLAEPGAFTADLSAALISGEADLVVHSWKDVPLEPTPHTAIVATLERADPRDTLLVRRDVADARPTTLRVLSSSPRRTWLLERALPGLLPWSVDACTFQPVRGNIPTRVSKLLEGHGDALVVAKAALDRLLGFGPPFEDTATRLRRAIAACRWLVLPLREVPGAPAQGAIGIEARRDGEALLQRLSAITHQPTWEAVLAERGILEQAGGGCHQAIGASVLPRRFGRVISVRGLSHDGQRTDRWSLVSDAPPPPRAPASATWPQPHEQPAAGRRRLDLAQPDGDTDYWVARAEALPPDWTLRPDGVVWAAGVTTWRRLASRGVWVNGCADGLGDAESAGIDLLAGRPIRFRRLTHRAAAGELPDALATYVVESALPDDLANRTHFFWMSGTEFRRALGRWPAIRDRWHGSGPGRTADVVRDELGDSPRARVWLDYGAWRQDVVA
jgi:hydroxymethylbilane synthase